ncbi:hypothetical protein QQF64_026081 [Cirrhinus molitorella]|uniref:Uncharacterized protein n=1 Tax=Cirrhinus molitorella TaxID=172907 RepID=A0ABR3NQV9_9TELE
MRNKEGCIHLFFDVTQSRRTELLLERRSAVLEFFIVEKKDDNRHAICNSCKCEVVLSAAAAAAVERAAVAKIYLSSYCRRPRQLCKPYTVRSR